MRVLKRNWENLKLFTVGPVSCYPEVLEEMKSQMFSHRSEEYRELHERTVERMRKFLKTKNEVFLFPSSSTGVMEGAVRCCVEEKMLCCISGEFGRRFAEVGEANGKIVEKLEPPLGKPITPELLDETLSSTKGVEAVSITYSETSIGLLNPLPELAKVVKKHGKLLFVDAVSALGGVDIRVDELGLDVCFAGSQKCLGIPPGLAFASVSGEALEKCEKVKNRGWYFDFKLFEKFQKERATPTTPPIPQILGLSKVLEMIEREGEERYFRRYRDRSLLIYRGVEELGLTTFPEKGYESPTVACVNAPKGMSGIEIYRRMRTKGYELALGYGTLKEKTFRIGNMGYIREEDILEMFQALADVLKS